MGINIRRIEHIDNRNLAGLIRAVFLEFDIEKVGTVYSDPSTDDLYNVFINEQSVYWVAEENGLLLGGCGIYPTEALPEACAELVKFYLAPASRGKGLGTLLMEKCFQSAKELGYAQLYLESFPQLNTAVGMYEKAGFKLLGSALGNSGHYACTIWMLKDL